MPSRPPGTFRLLTRPTMFLLHVPAAIGVVAAILLGNWQVSSWEESREDQAAALAEADPVPLGEVMGPDDPFPAAAGQPVTVPGTWAPEDTVYVKGKEYAGERGYWLVTPLVTCGSTTDPCAEPAALPIVLGWTPTVADAPTAPEGATEVTGWLQPGEGAGAPDADPADDVLTSLRIAELLQRSDRDLYGAFVILEQPAEARAGLEPLTPESLPDADAFTALRNLLYGVEWYLFAGFAVFLWWRWSRDEVQRARRDADDRDDTGPDVNRVSDDADGGQQLVEPRITSQA